MVEFYPSISLDLLNAALDFAFNYDDISSDERQVIIQTKKSFLFTSGAPWGKKTSPNHFDVTMGSYDGAETCELVGSFLLHLIKQKHGMSFGLYRDDGLGITNGTPRKVESIKKDLCDIFSRYGLKITIEANKKVVNFLDVTLNLSNGKHSPFIKPNNTPLYVHCKSNHPPEILKNIPDSINKRLSHISSDEDSFNQAAPVYQEALRKSGYKHQLTFSPAPPPPPSSQQEKRRRNIMWYNPPYSRNVSTNIGKTFLKIIDEEFPRTHILHKIFNRNTIKISYCCMNNIKQNIDGHNKSTLSKCNNHEQTTSKKCNCQKPNDCPLTGHCQTKSIIYQATVTPSNNNPNQTYIGLTETTFKKRHANHKTSFKHEAKKFSTELSKYIWELKNKKVDYQITWKILKQAQSYNSATKRCNLCIMEKYFIMCKPSMATLNKRNELVTACRHATKHLLKNFVT